MTVTRIKLTPAERAFVESVMGTLETECCSENENERGFDEAYSPSDLPQLDGAHLVLSSVDEINGELAWQCVLAVEQCDEAIGDNFDNSDQKENKAERRRAKSLLKKLTDAGVEPNC